MADSVCTPSKRVCVSNDEKEKGEEDIDRISDLPDSTLCHILSFLPTKMSVATSILSKRWIDLWTVVPVLSFNSTEFRGRFVDSIDKVLTMCQAQTIYKFSLDFKHIRTNDIEHLDIWISTAIKRNVQALKLNLPSSLELGEAVRLPDHVFACKTLVCLKLFNHVLVDVPANVCFQSLKIFQLEEVYYGNDGCLNRLLSGCPILEDFIVKRTWEDGISDMCINVPSLKRMNVKSTDDGTDPYNLLINTPLLERIELSDYDILNLQVEDSSSMLEARIHDGGTLGLIKGLGNVKFLSLSESVVRSLYSDMPLYYYMSLYSDLPLPVCFNLAYLEITTSCDYWDVLMSLLKCSDNLKALAFHIKAPSHFMGHKCSKYWRKTAPKCVMLSLKIIKLTGFIDQECNWELVQYILENAKFLKHMKIGTSLRLKKRRHRLRNMLSYPKASMGCEIGFFVDSTGQEFHL